MTTFTSNVVRHSDPAPFVGWSGVRLGYATGLAMLRAGDELKYEPREEFLAPARDDVNPIVAEYRLAASTAGPEWSLPQFLAAFTHERFGVTQLVIDAVHDGTTPAQREQAKRVLTLLWHLPKTNEPQPLRDWSRS